MPSHPTPAAHFESAAITDTGRLRDTNEDSLIALPEWGVFVVADGVGGLSAGELASAKVCESIRDLMDGLQGPISDSLINNTIRRGVSDANDWIHQEAKSRKVQGMGTTVVLLALSADDPTRAMTLHAGDSRVYRLRGEAIEQLTEDHSIAGELGVDENTLHPFMQGVITRAVGIQDEVDLVQTEVDVQPGDLFIVCSDGLTRMLPDPVLFEIIKAGTDLEEISKELVLQANEAGGHDNISLVLIRIQSAG